MNAHIESLSLIQSACWRELERASRDSAHEWHLMGVATLDGDGPDLRTVVLREVDDRGNRLVFYTDSRSPKVAQIATCAKGVLLVWSRRLGWQLRMRATLTVETGGRQVAGRWAQFRLRDAAQDYLSPLPPGAPLEGVEPEPASRDYFAVVTAHVYAIDWLELHADGRRRAAFDENGMRWVTP